jgi:hypothetical protein
MFCTPSYPPQSARARSAKCHIINIKRSIKNSASGIGRDRFHGW